MFSLSLALDFFVGAIIAAVFWFNLAAVAVAAEIAKILFAVFVVLFLVSLVAGLLQRPHLLHHLPKNYRLVQNGRGEYWVQRRIFPFVWRDFDEYVDGTGRCCWLPRQTNQYAACQEAVRAYRITHHQKLAAAEAKKQVKIRVIGRC